MLLDIAGDENSFAFTVVVAFEKLRFTMLYVGFSTIS